MHTRYGRTCVSAAETSLELVPKDSEERIQRREVRHHVRDGLYKTFASEHDPIVLTTDQCLYSVARAQCVSSTWQNPPYLVPNDINMHGDPESHLLSKVVVPEPLRPVMSRLYPLQPHQAHDQRKDLEVGETWRDESCIRGDLILDSLSMTGGSTDAHPRFHALPRLRIAVFSARAKGP